MSRGGSVIAHRGWAFAVAAPLLASACVQALAFWPGIMVWDSIRQYGQALTGVYDDWHPPAMNWLWRELGVFGAGPAPMLALQLALYWVGFALLALGAWRRGRPKAALAIALCAQLPVPFLTLGIIVKDSLMAAILIFVAGLIAVRPARGRALGLLAAALLIAAATLRFNAVPACLPLFLALLPKAWRRTPARLALAAVLAAVPLLLALPLANRMLQARQSGVELSLVAYDLGGITKYAGTDAFPPLGIADAVEVNARCYSPVSWDSYSWWVDEPCPIQFEAMRRTFASTNVSPYGWLALQIAAHPLAYAAHRFGHFDRNMRFLVRDADLPGIFLQSDPNPWGLQVPPSRLRELIGDVVRLVVDTPLGWPICWLALAIGVLLLAPDGLAVPLAWSSVLYAMSYLPLSVASEVRYHVWTMMAAAVAAVLALSDSERMRSLSRARLALAAMPVAIVTLLAVAARVTG